MAPLGGRRGDGPANVFVKGIYNPVDHQMDHQGLSHFWARLRWGASCRGLTTRVPPCHLPGVQAEHSGCLWGSGVTDVTITRRNEEQDAHY